MHVGSAGGAIGVSWLRLGGGGGVSIFGLSGGAASEEHVGSAAKQLVF